MPQIIKLSYKLFMKLVLGAVQFGKNYGLVNGKKINNYEFKKIEKLILRTDIKFIDTSPNYGSSEKIIGKSNLNKLNIITKIKLPKKNTNDDKWIKKNIHSSLFYLFMLQKRVSFSLTVSELFFYLGKCDSLPFVD